MAKSSASRWVQLADIAKIRLRQSHVVLHDLFGKVHETAKIEGDDRQTGPSAKQPKVGFAAGHLPDHQPEPDSNQPHPDHGVDAQIGQAVDIDIQVKPQQGRQAQSDILGKPQVDQRFGHLVQTPKPGRWGQVTPKVRGYILPLKRLRRGFGRFL